MSTYMANKATIERKWYVVDAAGKPLGKTAVIVADLLRGKGKVTYTPHADCGDNVIVINAGKATLSGNKMEQKYYRTHSGWIGGLKETKYRLLPKSVTMPIATVVAQGHGGTVAVTVAAVVVTGMLGNLCAPLLVKLFRVKDPMAVGLGIGACSHAMGTAKALELGETEGAMSGLAIGLCGILTTVLALLADFFVI